MQNKGIAFKMSAGCLFAEWACKGNIISIYRVDIIGNKLC
jgi:hypothetical protein